MGKGLPRVPRALHAVFGDPVQADEPDMSDAFLTEILKERLKSNQPRVIDHKSVAGALVEHVLIAAERGNVAAMSLIWDRVEGMAVPSLEVGYMESIAAPLDATPILSTPADFVNRNEVVDHGGHSY
jgi:hypothetical protein